MLGGGRTLGGVAIGVDTGDDHSGGRDTKVVGNSLLERRHHRSSIGI